MVTLVSENEHKRGENSGMLPMSLRDHRPRDMTMREPMDRQDREYENKTRG